MKKYIIILSIFTLILSNYSCEEFKLGDEFLVKAPGADVTIDTVYANIENAKKALYAAYSTLPYGLPITWGQGNNCMHQDVLECLTDLTSTYLSWGGANTYYYPGKYDAGLENDPGMDSKYNFTGEGGWVGIRRAWIFIDNIDKVPDADQETKNRLKGEALMIIAIHYSNMFRHYGGMPWVGKAFDPNEDLKTPRMTARATMDSIVGIIDRAIPYLPWQVDNVQNNEGHITRAGAKALKIRVLLFGASPLFNSNEPFYEGSKDYTWFGKYDASLWQRVVNACEDFINDLNANGIYALEDNPEMEPRDNFKHGYYDRGNSEVLIPIHKRYKVTEKNYNFFKVCRWGIARPTQEFVDMFPMKNGKDITDPTSGYNPKNPYIDRDPRLYASVIVNGDKYRGRKAELWLGGKDRKKADNSTAGTGYILRKFWLDGNKATSHGSIVQWPFIRLPEVYLSYAEALNEANNGPTPLAYEYLNKTRKRVKVGDVPTGLTKEEFRAEVLKERARELFMEEVRWFDLIRWKMDDEFFRQLHGILIKRDKKTKELSYEVVGTKYQRAWVQTRDRKWWLSAFPSDEINKDYGLIQNPGW